MTRCLPRRLLQPFKDTFFIDSAPVIECKSGMVVEQKKICICKVLFRRQNGIQVDRQKLHENICRPSYIDSLFYLCQVTFFNAKKMQISHNFQTISSRIKHKKICSDHSEFKCLSIRVKNGAFAQFLEVKTLETLATLLNKLNK